MKKIILMLLICSCTFSLYAQEMTDTTQGGKTKVKTDDSKTKMKEDKMKMKDDDGKVKVKGDGNMNSGTMNNNGMSSTTTTTTNVNVVTTWEAFPPKPATLPVVGNGVSADVVTTLKNKYGATLYDIKQIKSTSGQMIYVVRVMENGGMRNEYVGADGNTVSQ